MKKVIAILALGTAIAASNAAVAQEAPNWPLNAACSAGDDTCPPFEQRARGQVTGVWATLPPDVRSACISETEQIEKSYRLLYDCLANKMQEHITGQARGPEGGEVVQQTPAAQPKLIAPAPAVIPPPTNPAQVTPSAPLQAAPTAEPPADPTKTQ